MLIFTVSAFIAGVSLLLIVKKVENDFELYKKYRTSDDWQLLAHRDFAATFRNKKTGKLVQTDDWEKHFDKEE